MPKNPPVSEINQQRGGRGIVDVGCSFFWHVPSAGTILTAKALSLSSITLRAEGFFNDTVVYGTIRRVKSTSSARKIRIRRLALVLASIIGTWAFLGFLATIPVTGNHDLAAVVADGAFISFEDMISRATIPLSQDPKRSFWERLGLRLAGFRGVEWAVKPIYYLRTGIWLSREETNTLVPISQLGTRPILFNSGEKDEISGTERQNHFRHGAQSSEAPPCDTERRS